MLVARAVQESAAPSSRRWRSPDDAFTEQADRAKAMGVFGFVLSGGGVIGVLAGGVLTDLLSWHWIFLVNPGRRAVYMLAPPAADHGPAATVASTSPAPSP